MLSRRSLVLAPILAAAPARAAEYPDRAVRVVVPYPPGGAPDLFARLLAPGLSARLGQPVVVENRSGASGMIGTEYVARAAPDGYVLMMGSAATHAMVPNTFRNVPYDPITGFTPLAMVAETPNVLIVNPAFPARDVAELVAMARARPGVLNFGSTSQGGTPHMSGELLKLRTGIDMAHVPYRGSGPMLADLLGGHVSIAFDNLPAAMGGIRAGSIRALAVTTATRSPALPEVPSFEEAGIAGYNLASWFAVFGPAALPAAIVQRLNAEIAALVREPAIAQRLIELGATPATGTAEALATRVASELVLWRGLLRASGIDLQ